MDTNEKIKHFITLSNQYEKKRDESTLRSIKEVCFRYQIEKIGRKNKYGAQLFSCGDTVFRAFKGKLVTQGQSNLLFFKIIGNKRDKYKEDFERYCKRFENI